MAGSGGRPLTQRPDYIYLILCGALVMCAALSLHYNLVGGLLSIACAVLVWWIVSRK